jgi:hypothetical protein
VILRLLTCIGMDIFCLWQGFHVASISSASGHHYFPIIYVLCVILLTSGINKFGLITWPLTTVLLLIQGFWIIGWIPLGLVVFTLIGNEIMARIERTKKQHNKPIN